MQRDKLVNYAEPPNTAPRGCYKIRREMSLKSQNHTGVALKSFRDLKDSGGKEREVVSRGALLGTVACDVG